LSTFKIILTTTLVLLLGVILFGLGSVVWFQQQEIGTLQFEVQTTSTDVAHVQSQADLTQSKLSGVIKIYNRNFSKLEKNQNDMNMVLDALGKLILSGSGQPSEYKNPNTSGE